MLDPTSKRSSRVSYPPILGSGTTAAFSEDAISSSTAGFSIAARDPEIDGGYLTIFQSDEMPVFNYYFLIDFFDFELLNLAEIVKAHLFQYQKKQKTPGSHWIAPHLATVQKNASRSE